MNVDCRWLGTSVVRVRVLGAGLVLLAAGCMALGWSSRSGQSVANLAGSVPAMGEMASKPRTAAPVEAKYRTQSKARSLFAGLPLMFEPNVGQGNLDPVDPRAKFVARGSGYSLFLGSEGAILNLSGRSAAKPGKGTAGPTETLAMKLAGANVNASVTGAEPLPGKSNYLLGNDPAKWRRAVPQFARVRYESVYPGINLVFYGNQGRLEYDFQVAPGGDPKQAELQFDGAERLSLEDGALVIKAKSGSVRFEVPRVYQEIAGRQQTVEGGFVLRGAHRVGFSIGNYDRARELVIDPQLTFATFFGGANNEFNTSVAVDQAFNIYLAGSTNSPGLAVNETGIFSTLNGVQNVYIAKITPPLGSNPAVLDYVTYLGGSGMDTPVGIAVDGAQAPYVAGTTTSPNFPVSTNPYQTGPTKGSPGPHVFVTRMNNTGSGLVYSSYLSGSGSDNASGMTIDSQGFLYVTGTTTSTNPQDYAAGVEWPVISLPYGQPFQSTPRAAAGTAQFFVTKVNTLSSANASIAYSTYFGGGSFNPPFFIAGGGIAVDNTGTIYFTGTTNFLFVGQTGTQLTDFPILNAYQPCLDQPAPSVIVNPPSCSNTSTTSLPDAFLAKLNPNALAAGTGQLGWSTYLGGTGTDSGTGIAIDAGAANVYVTGTTNSTDIAESQNTATTSSAFQRCLDTAVNPPVGTLCNPPTTIPFPSDAFVAKFPNLTASTNGISNLQLTYFSYLGGMDNEFGLAIGVDTASGAILTGSTQSPDFPVSGAANIQNTYGLNTDAFIARLNTAATTQNPQGNWSSYYGGSGFDEGTSVALDVNQNVYFAGDTTSTCSTLQVREPLSEDLCNNGGSDAFVAELGNASTLTVSGLLTPNNTAFVSAGNQATFTYTVTNSGPDPAYNINVTDNLSDTGLQSVTFDSASATSGTCSGGSTSTTVICNIPSMQAGSTTTVTVVLTPGVSTSSTGQGNQQFTGGTVQVLSASNILLAQTSVPAFLSDYTMKIGPVSASVTAGNTASYQVSLTPEPVYTNSISLACSGVPAAASCNFTNSPITLAGASPGASTLNITTTVRPITTMSTPFLRHFYAVWLIVPGLALLGLRSGDRRRRRIAGLLLLCTVFSLLMLLPACSHATVQPPVSGTPAGTYTINVTATSGTDTKTQSIVLNVS